MITKKHVISFLATGTFLYGLAASVQAAEPFIYPAEGQTAEQQEKDKYDCYVWAKGQSGYDQMNPPKASTGSAPAQPRAIQGAARGAAAGAAIGAIAGDAGKGAAIGAATGGIGRASRNSRANQQQQAQAQQQQASIAQLSDGYSRAYSVCLEGRGYQVK